MRLDRPRIGIVGAGPAGLTLAHALLTLPGTPYDVTVFDRSDALKPSIGGGLQLSCGAATLARLGIDVSTVATPLRGVISRQTGGRELLTLDARAAMRDAGAPMLGADADGAFAIMRDSLQSLLAEPLRESTDASGAATLQLGRTVVDVRPNVPAGGSRLVIADADDASDAVARKSEEFVDLLVGCDGIGSVVKRDCFPGAQPPAYSGVKVLFAVAPAGSRPPASENTFHQWLGDGAYALSASYGGLEAQGGGNDVLALCYADGDAGVENAGWGADGESALRSKCETTLRDSAMPTEVLRLCDAATRFYETSVYFRNPSSSWRNTDSTAVLCGDAAHAMPPFLGQGANQAICDAYRLAAELKAVGTEHSTISAALDSYERQRWWPTSRLLLNSRILGFLETQRGPGALFRDAFFFTTGKLGVAEKVFLDAATIVA
jgi:salicylate hydroxylase